MLVCEPRRCTSNVDRMALEHLRAAGVIFPKPKAEKKIPKGRIGWKRYGPMRTGPCHQCGGDACTANGTWPYNMKLCRKCADVHIHAIAHGLKPSDEVSW